MRWETVHQNPSIIHDQRGDQEDIERAVTRDRVATWKKGKTKAVCHLGLKICRYFSMDRFRGKMYMVVFGRSVTA